MLILVLSLLLQVSSPQAAPAPTADQANAQAALDGVTEIYAMLGACERHYPAERVARIRQNFEAQPGAEQSALEAHIQSAYEGGRQDDSRSAAFCEAAWQALSAPRQAAPAAS